MDISFFPFLMAQLFPSSAIMYFIVWLAIWAKSYRKKIRHAWLAHLVGVLLTTFATTASIFALVFLLGGRSYNPDSPLTLFVLPGVLAVIVMKLVLGFFLKRYPAN